jgi:ribosomal protein S12 methylthiotransferase
VDGAVANALPDHIPPEVQQERLARLMLLQEEISAERLKRKIGKTITVLVDEVDEEGAIARSSADAPEIDGLVYIENGQQLKAGDFVEVKITDSDEHDLWAEMVP